MQFVYYIEPLLASVLYAIVFQKAGFRGALLGLCASPIVALVLTTMLYQLPEIDGMLIYALSVPLYLLPLLILAFKSWPPVAMPQTTDGARGDE
ncbi:MAG: hypothetical protein WBC90_02965 [Albidovulum sp.]